MSLLPNAMCIGPMKSGTSWIHNYLDVRGDVGLPGGVKETFFFDQRYEYGAEWYARHFSGERRGPDQVTLEVAPSYFHCKRAPERVGSVLGDIPLVVTLRNPIRRAWSHYLHLRRYGYTTAPLREAVALYPEVLEASRYDTCLARWERVFGRGRICVLWQEDLAHSPDAYAKKLCEGLSLPFSSPAGGAKTKRNQAALPRSAALAAFGDRTAHLLRSYQLYGVVNAAKRLGLKNVFFGRPGAQALPSLEPADAHWLADVLANEVPEWAAATQIFGETKNEGSVNA